MAYRTSGLASGTALSLLMTFGLVVGPVAAQSDEAVLLDEVVLTAQEQIKQALGASTITAEDIAKTPVVSDISEIIRRQPGINLTGNSASGQRGNQRQIDIRGMGPENTLILIDGKPVQSRNAVRMGRQGERDSRGDSSWVPPELVERIEVLRGPAAARYGSGASGGVVNIITKRPKTFTGSVGLAFDIPGNSSEGRTDRLNVMLASPIGRDLSFRVFANISRSEPDDPDINIPGAVAGGAPPATATAPAGSEGVISKDIGTLLSWKPTDAHTVDFEFNFSRQGNKYAGDMQTGSGVITDVNGVNLIGTETNRTLRQTASITHRGNFAFGDSFSYLQWENTRTRRLAEGPGGSVEGNIISPTDWRNTTYRALAAKTEWNLALNPMGRQTALTLGAELRLEKMDDGGVEFADPAYDSQRMFGLYAEANILWNDRLTLTPGLRYDHSDRFGGNLSPSLNATYDFTDEWSLKVGMARAFKAPNLFQMNPNYYYSTMGMGCPAGVPTPCEILGNPDLAPEHSFNKEIGIAYEGLNGISGSLTYFHNDYRNRIAADLFSSVPNPAGGSTLIWNNIPEARISGLEGNISAPLGEKFNLNVNFTKMLESINKQTGNPLSLVPKHTINASVDWQAREDLVLTLAATHYGRIEPAVRTLGTNVPIAPGAQVSRDPYTLVNLSAKWDLSSTAYVTAGINNVLGTKIYRTSSGGGDANTFNEPGRSFFVGLNKSF